MNTEIWDILDEKGISTGRTITRGHRALRQGEFHLVVHIWIVSSDGKILIQRRSFEKKLMPGEWAATGGAAVSGESSFTAARRELFEELGIKSNEDNLKKILRFKRKNSFLDVWLTVSDIPVSELILQKTEVAEAKWTTKENLYSMIKCGKFHNYGKEYFDKVFKKIEDYRGAVV